MKEDFLYYLWENRLLKGSLTTDQGKTVEIIHPGYRNKDSGPDFLEAKIQIGNELWAGHVEIHIKSSDWNRHGHQHDKAYRNVVLHVVYEYDTPVSRLAVLFSVLYTISFIAWYTCKLLKRTKLDDKLEELEKHNDKFKYF